MSCLFCPEFRGSVLRDEPLARHTALKVGGAADWFCVPADVADLQQLVTALCRRQMPYLVLGGGFNLLVRDGGFRGVVISTVGLAGLQPLGGDRLRVEVGVPNHRLAEFAQASGLAGVEFLSWIPGSFGGALAMNAGADGSEIMEQVLTLTSLQQGKLVTRPRQTLRYGYRSLQLQAGEVLVGAELQLTAALPEEIRARIAAAGQHRRTAQAVGYPSAGSFFKNPAGDQAWRLIDAAGLRGERIGGAQVSTVHANFLVNTGGASASDFLQLAARVKERVLAQSGIELEEEVRIVGAASDVR